jgi:hypothetical protein
MILSIMQPYFFPYIGYFQLIAHSDVFVVHDDVQYIKGGWVNRNRLRRGGQACWITLPVLKGAHNLAINQRFYQLDPPNVRRLLRRIESYYRSAPRFDEIFPLLQDIVTLRITNVASFNLHAINRLATYLDIHTRLVVSSELSKDEHLTGQERVIDICKRLGATHYVNPIGGLKLYQPERFAREGIDLGFLESVLPSDPHFEGATVPYLSIIDTLMFNTNEAIAAILKAYRIIRTSEDGHSVRPIGSGAAAAPSLGQARAE